MRDSHGRLNRNSVMIRIGISPLAMTDLTRFCKTTLIRIVSSLIRLLQGLSTITRRDASAVFFIRQPLGRKQSKLTISSCGSRVGMFPIDGDLAPSPFYEPSVAIPGRS
jgi:hypothetical protein